MGELSKIYSHFEVSAHKSVQDCWVIINGKVYNITSFLNDHPGGDNVLQAVAGKDASEEFEDVGHGSAARLMLDEFYIGEVNPSIKHVIGMTNDSLQASPVRTYQNGNSRKWSNKLWYLLPVSLGIVAYVWCGVN